MRDFRKLEIWTESVTLAKIIYQVTKGFPGQEKYGMCSQMTRAVVSIASNIAEGCSRKTSLEFSRFLDIALGSSFELETQIEICKQVAYLTEDEYQNLLQDLHLLQKRINAFRGNIRETI